MSDLQKLIGEYNKKNKGSIIKLSEVPVKKLNRTSTGSFSLDIATGGGFPGGSVVEFFGEESTGKSLLAFKAIVEAQKLGKQCIYIDLEGSVTYEWAEKLGVDSSLLLIARPETAEEALGMVEKFAGTLEVGIIVVDSVAALVPSVESENEIEKQQMGTAAKLMSKHLRRLTATLQPKDQTDEGAYSPCTVIYINQTREKIGVMFGSPLTTPGGKALKFYSSIRVHIKNGEILRDTGKNIIGKEVRFETKKNKTYKPFQVGTFKFYYTGGIDNEESVVQYAVVYELIRQSGAWFYFGEGDKEEKFQGKEKLVEYLKSKPKILAKLQKDIAAIVKKG
jgi:recombination protein RecA